MSAWSASSRPPPSYNPQCDMVRGDVNTYRVATNCGDDGLVEFGDDLPVGEEVGRVSFGDWKGAYLSVYQSRVRKRTVHDLSFISLMSAPAGR